MNEQRVPITPECKEKSYYKYYLRDLAPVSAEKISILTGGPGNPAEALPIEDRAKLMDPGYLPDEVGFYSLENGAAVVANNTFWPGVTGDMLQWYFAWHCLESFRYTIWDPFDHYGTEITPESRAKILDPNVSIPDKCFNVDHLVSESLVIGQPGVPIAIHFKDPDYMGFDRSRLGTKDYSFFVGANGEILTPDDMPNVPSVMVHIGRDVEDGMELRTRFWMGYQIIDGNPVCMIPPGVTFPIEMARQLAGHNFTEFTNLGSILPDLYKENFGTW